MRKSWMLPLVVLIGCEPAVPVDTDLTAPIGGQPTTDPDPGPTYSDEGSIVLIARHAEVDDPTDKILLAGVFAVSTRDYLNMATCLAFKEDTYCAPDLPAYVDSWVAADPWDDSIDDPLETRDIGASFRIGAYQANRVDRDGLQVYFNQNLSAFGPPVDGTLDLDWSGGDWGDYVATDVIPAPDTMLVQEPDPTRRHTLSNGLFPLVWTPGLVGEVYLSIESDTVKRVYRLEDDGQHDLDVDALGLTDLEEVKLTLARWTVTKHEQDGNEIDIIVQDEQILRAQYRDLSNRIELQGEDTCAQAQYLPLLTSGLYFGRLSNNSNQLTPSMSCGNTGGGPEQILRAQLNDGGEINLTYGIFNQDATLYLMASCGDMGTCLDMSDVPGNNQLEILRWVNDLGGPTDVFIALDARSGPVNDLYLLDVDIIDIFGSPLADSCADALYQTPLTSFPPGTDRYVGNINTFHNYADPAGACNVSAPGQEGMVKVELDPGETVQATVQMPGADPVVYLLYNCAISASCAAGSDADTSDTEVVSYTNQTGGTEVLYLVVDSLGGSASYTLDLLIQ